MSRLAGSTQRSKKAWRCSVQTVVSAVSDPTSETVKNSLCLGTPSYRSDIFPLDISTRDRGKREIMCRVCEICNVTFKFLATRIIFARRRRAPILTDKRRREPCVISLEEIISVLRPSRDTFPRRKHAHGVSRRLQITRWQPIESDKRDGARHTVTVTRFGISHRSRRRREVRASTYDVIQ